MDAYFVNDINCLLIKLDTIFTKNCAIKSPRASSNSPEHLNTKLA